MANQHLDLLLVNTPLKADGGLGGLYPSLSNLTLGSYLHRRGAAVGLLDPAVDLGEPWARASSAEERLNACAAAIADEAPGVLGITTMGPAEGSFAIALARAVRAQLPSTPILLGGSWATGSADAIIERFPWIDAVALGPGELSVEQALERGLATAEASRVPEFLAGLPGWTLRSAAGAPVTADHGTPQLRPAQSPPLSLELLRHPDAYDTMVYLTGRGCRYRCAFCSEFFMFHGEMAEPLDKVATDLQAFDERLSASYLWLCDPLFGASPRRLDALLPVLERSALRFLYESRVDTLRPADVERIRTAGGDLVYLGLEAVSDRSLLSIDKVSSPAATKRYREQAVQVVEACAAADVVPVIGVLNPVPGDGPEDLAETLALLERLNDVAEAAAERSGTDVRPFFHAFAYRIDPGTPAALIAPVNELAEGTTFTQPADALFLDREVLDASRTVDRDAAARFREQVRSCNRGGPKLMQRVLRSMPRPFLEPTWPGFPPTPLDG